MRRRYLVVILLILLFIGTGAGLWFYPDDIQFEKRDMTGDTLRLRAYVVNVFGGMLSPADARSASVVPTDLARLETGADGTVSITYLKPGSGTLLIAAGNERKSLALESTVKTMPDVESKEPVTKKPVSKLRRLYDAYRHVEKVHLRDGMILFGVMHEKPAGIDLITPDGTLHLVKDDVMKVIYLNPDHL